MWRREARRNVQRIVGPTALEKYVKSVITETPCFLL